MRGLPGDLNKRLQSTLRLCEVFESDRGLRAVFLDTRLTPWRDQLPQATSRTERALVAVDYLYVRSSASDENALVLLLQVLRDLTDAGDALYRQLDDLATEVTVWLSGREISNGLGASECEKQTATVSQLPVVNPPLLTRQPFEPELILIPAGEFLMGSDPTKDECASDDEQPQHTLYLPDYWIAKTQVTNAQYAEFVRAKGHGLPRHWENGKIPAGKEAHPVVYVSWDDAMAYCQWLSEAIGKPYTLPSEAVWEKAARGTDGRLYPWGNTFDKSKCNSSESGIGNTTPVDQYSQGASPYGVLDMAGNVWEWTLSLSRPYPYNPKDGREDLQVKDRRMGRGGAFSGSEGNARCAARAWGDPNYRGTHWGFRVVVAGAPILP